MTLAAEAWKTRQQARRAVMEGDLERAQELASRSCGMRRTAPGAALVALIDWLRRQTYR